jgi:hypothetical protein
MKHKTDSLNPADDRGIAESLADFKAGRSYGPFSSARDLVAFLRREALKVPPSKPRGSTAAALKGCPIRSEQKFRGEISE